MTTNGSDGARNHDRLQELARKHLMMHFTRHAAYQSDEVPVISHGEGCWLYDSKGKPVTSFVGRLKIFPLPEGSRGAADVAPLLADCL